MAEQSKSAVAPDNLFGDKKEPKKVEVQEPFEKEGRPRVTPRNEDGENFKEGTAPRDAGSAFNRRDTVRAIPPYNPSSKVENK